MLLISLLLLSVGTRARQRIDPLTGVVLEGMRPLQAAVSAGVDAAAHVWRTYVQLVGVTQANEALRQRVLELEQQAVRRAEVEQPDQRLSELLKFRATLEGEVQWQQL